ncbi:hypothetical protein GCM10009737_07850 [Nocardioides lentus]|uniref:HTH cro/C1-type domain-containing protein n=2 Tax=Nocardioides lentus TaxID=338077 RepID=A0ABP5AE79_9ACTN
MRLRDTRLLADYMAASDFSQARLARYAGCSRQFIHLLLKGERQTCTVEVAKRIEEGLRVLPGTLFAASMSTETRPTVAARRPVARTA